jgi:hypothetical protein
MPLQDLAGALDSATGLTGAFTIHRAMGGSAASATSTVCAMSLCRQMVGHLVSLSALVGNFVVSSWISDENEDFIGMPAWHR